MSEYRPRFWFWAGLIRQDEDKVLNVQLCPSDSSGTRRCWYGSLGGGHATLTISTGGGLGRSQRGVNRGGKMFCLEHLKHNYKDVAGAKSAFESFQKENMIVG